MDYLCIQGVVLSCKDAKVYGVESVSANETDINKAVITTLPHHEKELFTDASFVTEYKLDFDGIANKNAFISTADSGFFNTKSQVQTIALLTGDESTTDDIIYYDIIFLTCDSDGNWHKRAYNDIIGYEDEDDHGTYMSINFLDCDEDQVYYRYKGKSIGYSSPTLFSVIQAPPYYKEANSASASYTITHGHTSGYKANWGVGLSCGFKAPGTNTSFGGKYLGIYAETTNRSISTTLKLYPDQDYAISLVIPIVINKYDVYDPNTKTWSEACTTDQLEPTFSALPIDTYNELASELTDEEQRQCAPIIDNLPKSSAGDPYGYNQSSNDLQKEMAVHQNDKDKILETEVFINNDTESKSNSLSITDNSELDNGFSISFSETLGIGFTTTVSGDGGCTWIDTNSNGISYSITYSALPKSNKGNINNSTSDKYTDYKDINGNILQSNIYHYNHADYTYYANAIVYPSNELVKENEYGGTDTTKVESGIYLCSYYTHDFGGTPAELPEYFGVQSVTQNADGTYNITLAWNTSVKNEKRTPDAYNIYVESLNSKDKDLSLVNAEGPIMRNKGSLIMTYEAKNLSNPDKDFNFYIAAATTSVTSSKVMNVRESILMPAKTINVDNFLATDGLVITSQPESLYIDNVGQDAEFSIEVEDTKKDALNISYQWQTYNSKSGKWNPVTNNTSTEPNTYKFTTTADIIGTPIKCVITKTKSSSEHFDAISDIVTVFSKENHNHDYDEDGFCKICDRYEPAKYNKNIGAYEIGNAGQLFWFAALVNGDHTLANFSVQDSDANAVLTKDIDLKNREWKPINSYSGKFDGKGYNISNLKITESGNNKGLFGSINGADISNFALNGSISLSQNAKNIGGVVGESNGGKITNVSSYVNISNTENSTLNHIGGVVGSINKVETVVEKCTFNGNIVINNSHDCIGGVVGYTDDGGKINNCANLGSVSATKAGAYVSGILGYKNRTAPSITNCYNYGTVSNNGNTNCCGAIIGWARKNENISNNYYLSTSCDKAFGSNSTSGLNATSKTKDQFASGEVTYLLNNKVTDDTQAWYQNIDNGKTPDPYPVFVGGTVYKGCCGTLYSNSNKSNHNFNENGFCTNCGKYEPANYNSKTGNYEISNAGQLFWFASLVNGDRTHADFSAQDSNANAVLTKDIDLESKEWKPINSYSGKFDGKGYKINNLKITESGSEKGLFGSIDGADISNFTVSGSVSLSQNSHYIGGVVGESNSGKITNISSCVDISNTGDSILSYVGGVVGDNNINETVIEKCIFNGNITINNSYNSIGGIIGYTNGGAKLNNCANLGSVSATEVGAYVGGIIGSLNNKPTIKNSYNYGTVSNGGDSFHCGAIIGWARGRATASNNYYLSTSCANAVGKASISGAYATLRTKDQFASGEVTYLLNNKVTDDTQVWYQNIDNGKTPDPYPVFVGGTVYSKGNNEYTNYDPDHKNDEFKKDENGNFIIKDYDDLVKLSNLVRSDYKYYGSESYILTNNIVAKADSKWTQGIGSVSENKPFNGTFNGNGHYISGLNVDSPEYGGLFESIGDKGKVENLFLIDCDYITQSKVAGSIAAVNNGTIDHCLSGVNLTSGSVTIGNIHISPELNSLILGDLSGGVAGINNGTITGTRNAAIVMGTNCGGIAGENNGTIFGSANNGTIGKYKKEFADLAGGLAGTNNGIIKSSYNAEITDTTNKTYGSVAGVNNTSDVHNVHALCSNGIKFIGSGVALDSTNVSYSDYHDMRGESFAKIMDFATNSESIVWVSNELLNKGYPTIQIVDFSTRTIDGGNGIILKGAAHDELNITYNTTDSDEFNQLKADNKGKVLGTYSVSLTDKNGNYVPAELWCKENFEMSVPVDRSNIQLASIGEDGSISYYKPVKIENGKATFNVPYPTSFAIVETSDNSTNDTVTPSGSTPIKTGAVVCTALFTILVLSGAVFITVKRRNKFE